MPRVGRVQPGICSAKVRRPQSARRQRNRSTRAADILVRLQFTHRNKVSGYAVGWADHRSTPGRYSPAAQTTSIDT